MTETTACASGCGRPAPGATLCPPCTAELRGMLALAAAIAPDLDDAVARLLRHGGSGRRAATEPPLPVDLRASAAAAELRGCLSGWVAIVAMVAPPAGGIGGLSRWLLAHLAMVVRHERAADVHRDVRAAVQRCVMVLEPPPERVYAGPCPQCGYDVLGYQGAAFADCARCRFPVDVDIAQAAMRAALEDMLGGAAWCARMAARLGTPISENTVYSWVRRAQLAAHGELPDRGGTLQPVYRLGDVLNLIARSPARSPRRQHA
jgi:hypothetical protein